jgi:antitoxin HicB
MVRYPARIQSGDGGFTVSFRDIPEALTCADTREEAIEMAADALRTAMDFYFEDRRPVPLPSTARRNEVLVALPASIWAKVLLLNEMLTQGVTQAELARRLGTRPQQVSRIVDLGHPTKIDTIGAALASMGRELDIAVK